MRMINLFKRKRKNKDSKGGGVSVGEEWSKCRSGRLGVRCSVMGKFEVLLLLVTVRKRRRKCDV